MKTVMNQDIQSSDLIPLLYQHQRVLETMHYSWIKPLVESFPVEVQPLIVGALAPAQSASLQKITNISPLSVSSVVKNFIVNRLYTLLEKEHHLPVEYLPTTELTPLTTWNKKELVHLIDFLGLHDLAAEIRNIVNKRHLENIYSCLTPKQLYYLKVCTYQKEKLVPPKLGINPAEKNCDRLKVLIHQRGLLRLGKALSGQHPDLFWYIVHTLDIGRGKILMNYYKSQPIPNVTPILKLQVTNVMNFLKKSET
ncbi:MAG: hypothetical protein H0W88_01380 [Parachlamydiaceae bacterium]|nr:hypothetical protein [Parachlamydiaceae bacterium]